MKFKLVFSSFFLFTIAINSGISRKFLASSYKTTSNTQTQAIQNAINAATLSGDTVIIDKLLSPWVVRSILIQNKSNITILVQSGTIVRAASGFTYYESLFNFRTSTNINFIGYGAILEHDRTLYTDSSEFRHNINIGGSNGLRIFGFILRNSGGDGVNVSPWNTTGTNDAGIAARNIHIKDCIIDGNKRQGISITHADSVLIEYCQIENTNGLPPSAGIDIEPFREIHYTKNITIRHCNIKNNQGYGLMFVFGESSRQDNVNIKVSDVILESNSRGGILITDGYYGQEAIGGLDTTLANGNIFFERVWIKNTAALALYSRKANNLFLTQFKDCIFENNNNNTANPTHFGRVENSAFIGSSANAIRMGQLHLDSYLYPNTEVGNNTLATNLRYGGYTFSKCIMIDDENRGFITSYGAQVSSGVNYSQKMYDVTGDFLYINTGTTTNTGLYNNSPTTMVNVNVTRNMQTAYPVSTIAISSANLDAQENSSNHANFQVTRTSTNTSYPLPFAYEDSSQALQVREYRLFPKFGVIAADSLSFKEELIARDDTVAESNESVRINLKPQTLYYSITGVNLAPLFICSNPVCTPNVLSVNSPSINLCPGANTTLTVSGCTNGQVYWTLNNAIVGTGNSFTAQSTALGTYKAICSTSSSINAVVGVVPNTQTITAAIPSGSASRRALVGITATNKIGTINITPTANTTYRAGNSILLNPGFEVFTNSIFRAEIGACQ
ncbi:MAG: 3-coathanger stack domain-containing protein [Leadbetterella sp.]